MSKSYLDLSMKQRKEIIRWATQNVKKNEVVKIIELEMFMLDLPSLKAKRALTSDVVNNLSFKIFNKNLINI